jgi:hypothetical protein
VSSETIRALTAEANISSSVDKEILRAMIAENAEHARATIAEANITTQVSSETIRAILAEGAEAMRATTAEATLTQNLLTMGQNLIAMGNSLANETARANNAEIALRVSLAADEVTFSQMSTALVTTQTKLDITNDQLFQMQDVFVGLQNNYSKLMKFTVCSGRGMFADMNGNCFSASSSPAGTTADGVCTNQTNTTAALPACKAGFAPVSHVVTQSCGSSDGSAVTYTCTGSFVFVRFFVFISETYNLVFFC